MLPLGVMSQQGGAKFVLDGLEIHLDAGNPASYPGSGTSWFDTSGNGRTHSLGTAPYGSAGDIKYMNYSASGTAPQISVGSYAFNTEYTITGWHKVLRDDQVSTWRTLWRTSGFHPILVEDSTNLIGGYYGGFWSFGVTAASYQDVWTMYTIVATGGNSLLYLNGGYIGTIAYNETGMTWANISLNSQPSGLIATTAVYNRPLSAAEDLQNFDSTKSLYGL